MSVDNADSGGSLIEDALNIFANVSTGGLVGFDGANNGFTPGIVGRAGVQGLKEVTGAQAAEDANKLAREQFEQQKADALQDRENALALDAATQLQVSRSAGGLRRSTNRSGGDPRPSTSNSLGGDERDFLGL